MNTPPLMTGSVALVAASALSSGTVTARWGGRWGGIDAERGQWGALSQGYQPGGHGALTRRASAGRVGGPA